MGWSFFTSDGRRKESLVKMIGPEGPRGPAGGVIDFASFRKTSGNYTVSSNTWADLDTGSDLVVAAQVGDIIEVSASALWGNEAGGAFIDVATWVSGAGVHWYGSGEPTTTTGDGIQGWAKENAGIFIPLGSSVFITVQAGDISAAGTVTLRIRVRRGTTNTTLFASAGNPFWWGAKVLRKASINNNDLFNYETWR